ncbi:hypothetical protein Pla175_05700 [Pirellulimonas nuda]|uniref:Uncharacterized protein n=1 Tax=Pirellulimonas nuda TaxID=2528009 RepID=A0A518D6V4_9BACT|nr:hypothetical protein [Pirellulimonas nuda]QDU87213.1 hypothetical protein Pla175_05700 [Pirellulimonas nuda]
MSQPPRNRFRFGTRHLFLLTLIVAIASAGYGGMRRGGADRMYFVLFAAGAPLVVLVLAGLVREARRLFRRRPSDDDRTPFD